MLIALFFIILVSGCKPYDSRGDDTLQLCCQVVIFLAYFAGLMLMVEVPQSEQPLFGQFLLAVTLAPLCTAGFMIFCCGLIPMVYAVFMGLVKRGDRRAKLEGEEDEPEGGVSAEKPARRAVV